MNCRIDCCIIFGRFFHDFHVFGDIDFSLVFGLIFWWKIDKKRRRIGKDCFFWGLQKSILSPTRILGSLLVALWLHFESFWLPLAPFWWPLAPFWLLVGSLLVPVGALLGAFGSFFGPVGSLLHSFGRVGGLLFNFLLHFTRS